MTFLEFFDDGPLVLRRAAIDYQNLQLSFFIKRLRDKILETPAHKLLRVVSGHDRSNGEFRLILSRCGCRNPPRKRRPTAITPSLRLAWVAENFLVPSEIGVHLLIHSKMMKSMLRGRIA